VEGAERSAAFGRLGMVPAALRIRLRCEHGHSLALHVLGLGFLLLRVGSWELEEGKAPLLSSRALGRHVEQLQSRA
jgi:hypothetical protein